MDLNISFGPLMIENFEEINDKLKQRSNFRNKYNEIG